MALLDALARTERAFFSAALDPRLWNDAMDVAAREGGADGCILFSRAAPLAISPCLAPLDAAYAHEASHAKLEGARGHALTTPRADDDIDEDFADAAASRRLAPYQEFLSRSGYPWFAHVPLAGDAEPLFLSFERKACSGPFLPGERSALAQWGRPLSEAASFAGALGDARVEGACAMLDALGIAAVALGASGEILRANACAESLACAQFSLAARRIALADRAASDGLANALRGVLRRDAPAARAGPIAIARENRRPLALTIFRLQGRDQNPFAAARALCVIADLAARPMPRADDLHALFALTQAEAELACRLSTGQTLEAAAAALTVTKETARDRLKSVFDKTGTHKQGALVALLGRVG